MDAWRECNWLQSEEKKKLDVKHDKEQHNKEQHIEEGRSNVNS